jgi:UV DNA damage endonuclease
LDIHHNWVREGTYLDSNSDLAKKVIASWRGIRPTLHYSVSREDVLVGHDTNQLPDQAALITSGHSKQKLRAHSDYFWNNAVNEWALTFNQNFDIMCESKGKNLASFKLFESIK